MDIVEFLQARLDEDEAAAREAIALREATPLLDSEANTRPDYDLVPWEDVGVPAMLIGPERVLREVEAKRDLLEEVERSLLNDRPDSGDRLAADYIAKCLLSVYADHPDYDPEWSKG